MVDKRQAYRLQQDFLFLKYKLYFNFRPVIDIKNDILEINFPFSTINQLTYEYTESTNNSDLFCQAQLQVEGG